METGDQTAFMTNTSNLHDELLAEYGENASKPAVKSGWALPTGVAPVAQGTGSPTIQAAYVPPAIVTVADNEAMQKENMRIHREMQAYQNQMISEHPGLEDLLELNRKMRWSHTDARVLAVKSANTLPKNLSLIHI